jgi:hypothetical protein
MPALQEWAERHGIRFRAHQNGKSSIWDARTEAVEAEQLFDPERA